MACLGHNPKISRKRKKKREDEAEMGEKSDNRANPGTQKRENINKGGKGTLKGILLSWLHHHNIMCLPLYSGHRHRMTYQVKQIQVDEATKC